MSGPALTVAAPRRFFAGWRNRREVSEEFFQIKLEPARILQNGRLWLNDLHFVLKKCWLTGGNAKTRPEWRWLKSRSDTGSRVKDSPG